MTLDEVISVIDHCQIRGVCDGCPLHRVCKTGVAICDRNDIDFGTEVKALLEELRELRDR